MISLNRIKADCLKRWTVCSSNQQQSLSIARSSLLDNCPTLPDKITVAVLCDLPLRFTLQGHHVYKRSSVQIKIIKDLILLLSIYIKLPAAENIFEKG